MDRCTLKKTRVEFYTCVFTAYRQRYDFKNISVILAGQTSGLRRPGLTEKKTLRFSGYKYKININQLCSFPFIPNPSSDLQRVSVSSSMQTIPSIALLTEIPNGMLTTGMSISQCKLISGTLHTHIPNQSTATYNDVPFPRCCPHCSKFKWS